MIERRQGTLPTNFQFRGLSPVFAHENFRIESSSDAEKTTATLLKQDGSKAVLATAIWD